MITRIKQFFGYKPKQKGIYYPDNAHATKCMRGLDDAYFSFECGSDFDYFLNALEAKIQIYRNIRKS